MKKPATPHPRKRRPFDVLTNKKQTVSKQPPSEDEAEDKNASALKRLHVVHSSVGRLLEKIDTLVTGIHKKKLAQTLDPDEIDNFTRAMSNMELTVQEWHDFFLQGGKRPSEPEMNHDLIPIIPTDQRSFLSDSPLVPHEKHDFRKALRFSPAMSPPCRRVRTPVSNMKKTRIGTPLSGGKRVTFASSPITITPVMPSPPRSVRQRRPSCSSSSSSSLSTPSFLVSSSESPASVDLSTPEPPADIVSKYSSWFCKSSPGLKPLENSPDIGVSPPRTCAFLGTSGDEEAPSPTALLSSPFRTPGLVLLETSSDEETTRDALDLSAKLAAASL